METVEQDTPCILCAKGMKVNTGLNRELHRAPTAREDWLAKEQSDDKKSRLVALVTITLEPNS